MEDRFGLALSRSGCLNYPVSSRGQALHRLGFVLKRPRKWLRKAGPARRDPLWGNLPLIVSRFVPAGVHRDTPGELLALRWDAADLEKAEIRTCGSLGRRSNGLHLSNPQTIRGNRTVSVDASTVAVLRRHKELQDAVVSERLGHSNPTITMKIYAHARPGWQRLAADDFARTMAESQEGTEDLVGGDEAIDTVAA